MIGVNLATFIVFMISVQEFQMRDSRLSSVFVSLLLELLQYVVLLQQPSFSQIINIGLAAVVTPDKSYHFEQDEEKELIKDIKSLIIRLPFLKS